MAKYYQRPDGLYEVSRTINGKRVRFRGRTTREVDRKILEYQEKKSKGRKVAEIAEEWLEQHEGDISRATYLNYRRSVERIGEHFNCYASEVKPLDVKRFITSYEQQGYALATINLLLTTIKQVFAYAVLQGDIDINPTAEVQHGRNLPSTKRSALTKEQEQRVINCRTGKWWLMGLMFLYTGCRRGELLALTWEDIDRERGVIHINKKINYVGSNSARLEHHLKSKNGLRDIPLLEPLKRALPDKKHGIIFSNGKGGYMSQGAFYRAWAEYCADAGLEAVTKVKHSRYFEKSEVTPHQFRHSFSTICYEAGIDPKAAASMMGDTEEVVRKIYTDLRAEHKATSVDKLNAYFAIRDEENSI